MSPNHLLQVFLRVHIAQSYLCRLEGLLSLCRLGVSSQFSYPILSPALGGTAAIGEKIRGGQGGE